MGRLPPLHALAAFEAAARLETFARAAEELCVTHSAVSHRIRQLEDHLQAQLLVRTARRVVPTPQGERFLGVVRAVLGRLDRAASNLRGNSRLVVRASVLPAFVSRWLIGRVGGFYRDHPDIDLEVQTTTMLANLRAGEADVAIRFGGGAYPGLASRQLFTECVFPVASPRYLEMIRPIRSPGELRQAVLLRNAHGPWKPWFAAAGLDWDEPSTGPLYTDIGFLLDAAVNGQGIALGRSSLVEDQLQSGQLARVTDVSRPSDWNFFLVHVPDAVARPEVNAFVQWLLRTARASIRSAPCGGAAGPGDEHVAA